MGREHTPRTINNHEPNSHKTNAPQRKTKMRPVLIAIPTICLTAIVTVAISYGATAPGADEGERFEQIKSNILVGKTDARPHEATVRKLARLQAEPPAESGRVMVSLVGLPPNAVVIVDDKVVHSPLLLPRGHYTVTLNITAAGHSKIKAVFVPNRSKIIDLSDHTASTALMPLSKEQDTGPTPSSGAITKTPLQP